MRKIFKIIFFLFPFTIYNNTYSQSQCNYTINMQDSWGDGWNGASVNATINGISAESFTIISGSTGVGILPSDSGDIVQFSFIGGSYDNEVTFDIIDPTGNNIGSYGPNPQIGPFLLDTSNSNCEPPTCPQPYNLSAQSISSDTVNLTWTPGLNESQWLVYLVPTGSSVLNATPALVSSDSVFLTTNPSSEYDFYVQAICGTGDSSFISGPFTFSTPCLSFATFPYMEDFSSWPPLCWDLTGGSQSCIHYNNSAVEASFYSWSSGQNALMTSPVFDVSSLSSAELLFDWSHQFSTFYPNDALEVLVSDDGGVSWSQVWYKAGEDLESNDGATTYSAGSFISSGIINLSSFSSNFLVRFNFISGYGPDCFIDNVEIRESPTCPQPYNLSAQSISSDTVNLTWTPGLNESQWLVYLVPTGSSVLNATPALVSSDSVFLTTNPSSEYDFYVQAICGTGDSSFISGPFTFFTPCTFSQTPYFTNMNNSFPNCWIQEINDDFDWIINSGTTTSTSTGPSDDMTGGGSYLYTETSSTFQGDIATIYSPILDLSSLNCAQLRFFTHMYGASMGSLSVDISDDGGQTYNNIFLKSGNQGDQWVEELITLGSYSSNVVFKITGTAGSSYEGDMAIDNFEIREPTQLPPNDLGIVDVNIPFGSDACSLGLSDATIIIKNYGASDQFGFNVEYFINGIPYIETIFDTIYSCGTYVYTLNTPIDMTNDGVYDFTFSTALNNDSNNNNDEFGPISFENFYSPVAPTAEKDTFCISPPFIDSFTLSAIGPTGVTIEWFDSLNGNSIASGDSIVVFPDSVKSYWAAYKDFTSVNIGRNDINDGGFYPFYGEGLIFEVNNTVTIDSVTIYPAEAGIVQILIENESNNIVYSNFYNITTLSPNSQGTKVPIGINVQPGNYEIKAGNSTTTNGLFRNTGGSSFPYNYGDDISITGPTDGNNEFYYFFYNWDISTESCYSDYKEFIFQNCTNIIEKDNISFDIIPNPNNGLFNIIFSGSKNGLSKIKIYDIGGKMIYGENTTKNINTVNISNIEKGIYLVTVESNLHKTVKRIIIQ